MDWTWPRILPAPGPDILTAVSPPATPLETRCWPTDANLTPGPPPIRRIDDGSAQWGRSWARRRTWRPEQARGEPIDTRADVFALGSILCTILTGQPPFTGTSSLDLLLPRPGPPTWPTRMLRLDGCGADAELAALARRCLSPNPVDRPANGQAVADELIVLLERREEAAAGGRAGAGGGGGAGGGAAQAAAGAVHPVGGGAARAGGGCRRVGSPSRSMR